MLEAKIEFLITSVLHVRVITEVLQQFEMQHCSKYITSVLQSPLLEQCK